MLIPFKPYHVTHPLKMCANQGGVFILLYKIKASPRRNINISIDIGNGYHGCGGYNNWPINCH